MNRIILIGNGFDLAHDLKTSYKNFIDDFWEKQVNKMLSTSKREKEIDIFTYEDNFVEANAPNSIWELIKKTTDTKYKGYNLFLTFVPPPVKDIGITKLDRTSFVCKNTFLQRISEKHTLEKWVDIEYEYYQALIECLENEDEAKKLNGDFNQIKTNLENYLGEQNKRNIIMSNNILDIFFSGTEEKDIVFFLNFNYTKTIHHYTNRRKNVKTINIHGELNNHQNPIIFGYGDELDDNYKNIEKTNNKSFLENVKSIKYSITNNYREMLAFLNGEEYEVFIIGHSCGLSDRTLLNTIVEHKNCKLVKIFYHQIDPITDNYLETYINLSRNFNDKKLLRAIVLSKENSVPLLF